MTDSISLIDALQLAGLLPCLFVMILLCFLAGDWRRVVVPVAYFVCLACSFMLPLTEPLGLKDSGWYDALLMAEQLQPALCLLLVLQFFSGAPPRPVYWLTLAVPFVATAIWYYHVDLLADFCQPDDHCPGNESLRVLYSVFAGSAIFLLLVACISRASIHEENDVLRRHKYWLVVAFIGLYLAVLALDLAWLSEHIERSEYQIITTVIRISFIYLVLTSLFRIFDQSRLLGGIRQGKPEQRPIAPELLGRIEAAMCNERLYREMGFSRESLAQHLELTEHILSRVINQHYGKNFNEFVNGYRVEEAKQRLREETTPVTAIAFEVGFSSIASFNRVFKLVAGCSPTEYRSQSDEGAFKRA